MVNYKESDFIKGDKSDVCDALLISQEVNSYIDSVLERIYGLDLTPEEEKELGLKIHREKYDDSWKRVEISFGPGNTVTLSRRADALYGCDPYRVSYDITCNGQLDTDRVISALSGFGIVCSHNLFSYSESKDELHFSEGTEQRIKLTDSEAQVTEYQKLGLTKKSVFKEDLGGYYSFKYLDRDSYKEESRTVDGKYTTFYYDLEGNPLTQPEVMVTTFDSFNDAYASFTDKFRRCRDILDSRIEEIIEMKNQSNK